MGEGQRLRFAVAGRLELEVDLAVVVRRSGLQAVVGEAELHAPPGERRAVVVGQLDLPGDLLAAEKDLLRNVYRQVDRLQLELVDLERGLVRLLLSRLVQMDAVVPLHGRVGKREVCGERAELAQRHLVRVEHAAARVVDVELVLLPRPERELVVRHPADDPLQVHKLPGTIRRPVGVEITLRREPHREVEPVEAEGPVAHHADDPSAEPRLVHPDRVPGADAEAAERAGVEPVPRPMDAEHPRDRRHDVAAVSDHDRVLVEHAVELGPEPVVVERRRVGLDLVSVRIPPLRLRRAEALEPCPALVGGPLDGRREGG